MFIGTKKITDQNEINGRIHYKLEDNIEGNCTKRQFDGMATKEARPNDDQLTIMIDKHTEDVADILNTIYNCQVNYNEAIFLLERARMSLNELQESALCKVIGEEFNTPMAKLVQANEISLKDLNSKIK